MPWIFPPPQVYICSPLILPLESCRTLPILPVSHFTHFPIFFPPHSALPFRLQAVKILFLEFSNLAGFSIVLCIEFAFTNCWMNKRPAVDQTQNSISNVYVDHCTYDSPCLKPWFQRVTFLCIAVYQCGICEVTVFPHNIMTLAPPSDTLSNYDVIKIY